MHPAPIPPRGIATCSACATLKVRCGPACSRSDAFTAAPAFSFGTSACVVGGVTPSPAAPIVAADAETMNSRRLILFECDMVLLRGALCTKQPDKNDNPSL